ncbi:MAG: hypothetical protein U9N56_05710 [Actinomycetota bacterium]|nr:hypothetical protein [Actinomycetota bacterium]
MNHLTLFDEGFPSPGSMDTAVSHAILKSVANKEMGESFRLHRPGPVVAFGRADRASPGYPEAVQIVEQSGFAAIERLAGGRAAVFHEQTLAFSWATPDTNPRSGIEIRFETIANLIAEAFSELGIDSDIGELPGEYCPGRWSLSVAGRSKVMGVGQRLIRGAAHVGGVIVIDQGYRIREVLTPVYEALGLVWNPSTVGALTDVSPGLKVDDVATAVVESVANRFDLEPAVIPEAVVDSARLLMDAHLPKVA